MKRDFILTFKPDWHSKETRSPLYFDAVRAEKIRQFLSSREQRFEVMDEKGNYQETLTKSEIQNFRRCEDHNYDNRWICGYGVRHGLIDKCDCKETYGTEVNFFGWLHAFFPDQKFIYSDDITDFHRSEYVRIKNLTK